MGHPARRPCSASTQALDSRSGAENVGGKGDRHLLCEAPEGPFRQKVPVTFSAGRAGTLLRLRGRFGNMTLQGEMVP